MYCRMSDASYGNFTEVDATSCSCNLLDLGCVSIYFQFRLNVSIVIDDSVVFKNSWFVDPYACSKYDKIIAPIYEGVLECTRKN